MRWELFITSLFMHVQKYQNVGYMYLNVVWYLLSSIRFTRRLQIRVLLVYGVGRIQIFGIHRPHNKSHNLILRAGQGFNYPRTNRNVNRERKILNDDWRIRKKNDFNVFARQCFCKNGRQNYVLNCNLMHFRFWNFTWKCFV